MYSTQESRGKRKENEPSKDPKKKKKNEEEREEGGGGYKKKFKKIATVSPKKKPL